MDHSTLLYPSLSPSIPTSEHFVTCRGGDIRPGPGSQPCFFIFLSLHLVQDISFSWNGFPALHRSPADAESLSLGCTLPSVSEGWWVQVLSPGAIQSPVSLQKQTDTLLLFQILFMSRTEQVTLSFLSSWNYHHTTRCYSQNHSHEDSEEPTLTLLLQIKSNTDLLDVRVTVSTKQTRDHFVSVPHFNKEQNHFSLGHKSCRLIYNWLLF